MNPSFLFSDKPKKLQVFLIKTRMYLDLHQQALSHEHMKIMYIERRLSETAFDWFEPYMRKYYEKNEADMQIFTK